MIDVVSVIASTAALIISIIALWRAYFAVFKPLIVTGDLFFRIFPVKNSDNRWFIPSATVTIAVANEGARPGTVLGWRLIATYPKQISTPHFEVWTPKFELNASNDELIGENRFSWFNEHPVNLWKPVIIAVGSTVVQRLVFETRWDNPIAPDLMVLSLEIFTGSKKKWMKVSEWNIKLGIREWAYFSGRDGGMRFPTKGNIVSKRERQPDNLNSRLIYRGPVPASWSTEVEPSFLAYEEDNKSSENDSSA